MFIYAFSDLAKRSPENETERCGPGVGILRCGSLFPSVFSSSVPSQSETPGLSSAWACLSLFAKWAELARREVLRHTLILGFCTLVNDGD